MSGGSPRIGTFKSGNALPGGGYRGSDGSANAWGTNGVYWSSTPGASTSGYRLTFYSGGVYPSEYRNAQYGFSVRCVRP
jgi:hypothetical protein